MDWKGWSNVAAGPLCFGHFDPDQIMWQNYTVNFLIGPNAL
jgi:hypothetical protein